MMNEQIIYIAMYRALECLESESKNNELSDYLDKANPYVFKDRKSADPFYYNDFCKWVSEKQDIVGNSFLIAKDYIQSRTSFGNIFDKIDAEEWNSLIKLIENEEPEIIIRK